jgi:hypothetical protein
MHTCAYMLECMVCVRACMCVCAFGRVHFRVPACSCLGVRSQWAHMRVLALLRPTAAQLASARRSQAAWNEQQAELVAQFQVCPSLSWRGMCAVSSSVVLCARAEACPRHGFSALAWHDCLCLHCWTYWYA